MVNNTSHIENFEELCAGYVLHALDEEERKEFEEMLGEASEQERILYQELWSAAHQLAFTVDEQEPPKKLKERLMAQIRAEADELENKNRADNVVSTDETSVEKEGKEEEGKQDKQGFKWTSLAAAASFVLLIVSLSLIFYSFNLSSEISRKESIIEDQQTHITELQNEVDHRGELLSILESRDLDLVVLNGLDVNPNGYGKVMWDPAKQRALLQVSNLPAVPSNKDYQLWIIKNNKPVSAGVFAVNNQDDKFFKIEQMAPADKQVTDSFAVTVEPKGGSPQPTGDMYLLGNLNDN